MSLAKAVRSALDINRLGGSLVNRDAYSIIAYNCQAVSFEQLEYIARKHTRTSAVIQATDTSSSGFIVVFTEDQRQEVMLTADFFNLLTCSILCAISVSLLI